METFLERFESVYMRIYTENHKILTAERLKTSLFICKCIYNSIYNCICFVYVLTYSLFHPLVPRTILTLKTAFRAVGLLGSLWKHQQSRDRVFLHQSCTQLFFSTPKKNIFLRSKKNPRFFSEIWRKKSKFDR